MTGAPLISVIMAVRNCEKTLRSAIESINEQTYANWELVVCDDASTDSTRAVLDELVAEIGAERFVVLMNETNRKLAYSLNRCLESASGRYIARMDGDDSCEPDRFERQMHYLREHPDVDLVGTAMRRFNDLGLGGIVYPASEAPDRWTMSRSTRAPFCHGTVLAKRSVFETVGNYTVSWRTERGQDTDLWLKFFAAGLTGRNLRDPLYRVREDAAAVRRRTPRARFGEFVTRVTGYRTLKYPPLAYVRATVELSKVLVPYRLVDAYASHSARRRVRQPESLA